MIASRFSLRSLQVAAAASTPTPTPASAPASTPVSAYHSVLRVLHPVKRAVRQRIAVGIKRQQALTTHKKVEVIHE